MEDAVIDTVRAQVDAPWSDLELASKGAVVAGLTAAAGCRTTEVHLADRWYEQIVKSLPASHDRIAVKATNGIRHGLIMYTPNGSKFDRLELIAGAKPANGSAMDALVSTVCAIARPGINVVISGWAATSSPGRLFRSLRAVTARCRAHFLVDSRSLRSAYRCKPDILKVTAAEASTIFGRPMTNQAQIISLLSDYPLSLFAITCGSDGAYLRVGRCFAHMHRPARAVNTVGAGDSAMSVIAALFGTGVPTLEIGRRAIYAASRNVEIRREGGILEDDDCFDEVVVTLLRVTH